jgi:hypothetical protein
MAEKFLDDAGTQHLIAGVLAKNVAYTPPTSGPLAGMSLTNAVAYINQLLNGEHKNITLDVNTVKVPLS